MAGIDLILNVKNKLTEALGRADGQVDKFRSDAQRKLDSIKMPTMTMGGGLSGGKIAAIDELRSRIPELDTSLTLAGSSAAALSAGVVAVGGGIAYATKLSHDWEQGMAKVNVTAQLNKKELKGLSSQLREIGKTAPADIMQIPEAFNTIISAVGDVDKSLKILPLSLKAAKASATDLKIVADASVSVINASGRNPEEVYNVLFATMNKGKAEFKDIAQYLPKIIPTSRALGLSLEQTAGSWALLTAKGLQSEQATTGMQNLIKALGDGRIMKNMKGAGLQAFDKEGNLKQITEIVNEFKAKTAGLSDKGRVKFMDAMGFDQEASMALNIMVQNVNDLKNTIGFVGNGADHLNQAMLNSATSTDMAVMIANRLKYELMAVGDSVLESIKPPLVWMYNHLDTIIPVIKAITVGIMGGAIAWGLWKLSLLSNIPALMTNITLSSVLLGISTAIAAVNPFAWIGLAIAGIALLWMKWDKFRYVVMGGFEAIKMGASIWWNGLKNVFGGVLDMLGGIGKAIFAVSTGNISMLKEGVSEAGAGLKRTIDGALDASVLGVIKNKDKLVGAYKTGYANRVKSEAQQKLEDSKTNAIEDKANQPSAPTGPGADYNANRKDRASGAQDAISSSTKTINITVNGGMVSGGIEINVTELSKDMGWAQIEDKIGEVIMKTIRNIEVNY